MSNDASFRGLRTAIYAVADVPRAKAWYAEVLERAPYFDEEFYVGFNVGGGVKIGAIKDPFGNVLGVVENPHFRFGE